MPNGTVDRRCYEKVFAESESDRTLTNKGVQRLLVEFGHVEDCHCDKKNVQK